MGTPETHAWATEFGAPDDAKWASGWAHHDLAVLATGEVVGCHPGSGKLVVFSTSGEVVKSVDVGVIEAHGITLVVDDDTERLWIADCGVKAVPTDENPYGYKGDMPEPHGKAIKVSLDGDILVRLQTPSHPLYEGDKRFLATSIAVDEVRHGGRGDIWVADGYGASLVHRFNADGEHVLTIDGEDGPAGRFNCPHGIFIDRRKKEPELYIADRGNARIVVYGLDGGQRRVIEGFLTTPSNFAVAGDLLVVAELNARLTVLDRNDALVCHIGSNEEVVSRKGWPNAVEGKRLVRPELTEGLFNSPHGLATDADGNVYVSEWLIGGRFVKLVPTA